MQATQVKADSALVCWVVVDEVVEDTLYTREFDLFRPIISKVGPG